MESHSSRSRIDAEVDDIVHVLRRYGVLTGNRLATLCGAERWQASSTFTMALERAISHKRIRRLGDDLYELTEDERS